jgi:hypothetical protein
MAMYGFVVLGTNAASALPDLLRAANASPVNTHACCALASIGREGQLHLLSKFPDPSKNFRYGTAGTMTFPSSFAHQKHFEPEIVDVFKKFALHPDANYRRMALLSIRALDGNLDMKRPLIAWALKDGSEDPVHWAVPVLENTPELVEEFQNQILALKNLTDSDAIALRDRLLAPTNSVGE